MISSATEARLSILLPNTNKALAQAIANATPEQLVQLKEGKDIKSLLMSVFHDKITESKSDQALLDILKNGAVFKNMGNFSEDLKSLLSNLKNLPEFSQKASVAEGFLKDILSLDPQSLKHRISNSGIFMESKIAAAAQILPALKETLESLRTLVSRSSLPDAGTLQNKISSLIESPLLTHGALGKNNVQEIAAPLKQITDTLRSAIAKSDVLYSPQIARFAEQLEQFAASSASVQEMKTALSQLYSALLSSKESQTNPLLDSIESLLKNLSASPDPLASVKEFSGQLRTAISSGDVILSDEGKQLMNKLGEFALPEKLLVEDLLQESLGEDLKSHLMRLAEELQQSPDPKAAELLDPINKLLTQIDYHQLLSHLSTSSSIYLPFEWDLLEEGSMTFKKNKEKKFYCEINLTLKTFGKIDLMMALYEGNQLELQAHTEKPELKTLLEENLPLLRKALIDAELTPRRLRIIERKENPPAYHAPYEDDAAGPDLGFEVKV